MKLNTVLFTIILFAVLRLTGCDGNKNKSAENEQSKLEEEVKNEVVLSQEARKNIELAFEEVKEGTISGVLKAPARLIPNQDYEAQVGSLVQGRVQSVFVKEGDFVKEGQVLMQIEGLQIGELEAEYLQAKSNHEYLKAAFERQKILMEQNVSSQKSFQEAKAAYERALAEYNAADMRIHGAGFRHEDVSINRQLEHIAGSLPIRTPISGIVTERNVVIGQLVEANSTAFRIMNTISLWAEGQIYEKDITKISGEPKIEFVTSAYPDEKFRGKMILMGQTVDEHSRTVKVRAVLRNTDARLKPNMFGEMLIPIAGEMKGIVIPADAVIKEGDKYYVFLVQDDAAPDSAFKSFKKQYVEPGIELGGKIEILNGLKKGEKVVTQGSFQLKSELLKEAFAEEE